MFLEFILLSDAYEGFRRMHIKESYPTNQNTFFVQQRSLNNNVHYIQECCAFINKKGVYGTKSAQDNTQNHCIISISTPTFDENIHIKFITSNVICKYYPNLNITLSIPENNKKLNIKYCSLKKHVIPIYYKKVILDYDVIGLPIKFIVDFFPIDPVCGSKIQDFQLGQIITLKKPLNFEKPCTLIIPGNSIIEILKYEMNYDNFISCIKMYDGRLFSEKIVGKKEICSNNSIANKGNTKFFKISCSQGELVINTSIDNLNQVEMYKKANFNETSITFIVTKLPETDFSFINSLIC